MFAKKNIIKFNNIPNLFDLELLNNSIYSYVKSYGYSLKKAFYNFVSKEELLRINREFLNHNYHTDIISFDYTNSKIIEADFYLSMWAIKNSAKKAKQTIENETLRVIIHGVLHCMGYNDKTSEQLQIMRNKEEEFISLFHVKQNSHV
ncbi:MAG: rRNA maturation RNase YbeY [Flavobacteriaceae bacterium]|nr:rRNA maturation RNase YbeY [Flavobacteriaceae bacterium]